jgi:putative restriction endonuclease
MPDRRAWSREQLLVALKLYCEMPFGKMHSQNPEIIRHAKLIGRTPSALAMKLTNFASLDPEIRSTGRKGLSGASQADRDIWNDMTSNWNRLAIEIAESDSTLGNSHPTAKDAGKDMDYDPTCFVGGTREAVIEARVGQNFFRKAVLSAYEYKCCISGLAVAEMLVASHIVPWREDAANRLNPRNGLCLSAIHDRAFDLGLITISESLRVVLSTKLKKMGENRYICDTFGRYEGCEIQRAEKFSPHLGFLKHHREITFVG